MILCLNTTNPEKTSVLLVSLCHPRLDRGSKCVDSRFRHVIDVACGNDIGRSGNDIGREKNNFKIIDKKVWGAGENQSEELLPAIDAMLKKHKIEFRDVKLIIVSKGSGSFTGTRVGISVANALSFSLKIPVVGVKTENINIEKIVKKGLEIYQKEKPKDLVIPHYSKKPNITTPKK